MVSSQIPPPPPNPLPSRTATLAPPHPVPVCSNTRTWISTSTSLWASWARMRVRRVQLTMKSSFPRLHIFSSSPLATLLRHARPPRRTYARFVVPERNNADADPSTRLDHARACPDQGLDFDLTSHPSVREGWADWPTQQGLGGSSVSPSKVDEFASSPAVRRADLSRAMEEDYRMDGEEKEDVMGLLFGANASDDDFMPPSGWARARARAERSLWTVSLTRRRASALLQVRQSRGRGGPSSFRTKLRLYIGSKMATMITKATKPIRVRAQY